MTDQPRLRATRVVLTTEDTDESKAAIAALGKAVHALDVVAYDTGYQLDVTISRLEPDGPLAEGPASQPS
jgi:hypothetical protein